jgi:hypothetical protein
MMRTTPNDVDRNIKNDWNKLDLPMALVGENSTGRNGTSFLRRNSTGMMGAAEAVMTAKTPAQKKRCS